MSGHDENKLSRDVASIAADAARQVPGIHSVGKSRLSSSGALDVDVVVDYGVDIVATAAELRRRVAKALAKTAGRELAEVNVHVAGVKKA